MAEPEPTEQSAPSDTVPWARQPAPGDVVPWAREPVPARPRHTGRLRRVAEGLPDWEPMPPGDIVVRRPRQV